MPTVEMKKIRVLLKKAFVEGKNYKTGLPNRMPNGQKFPYSIDGIVVNETPKAIYIDGHASVDAPVCCCACGRALTHPVSRLIGIGPICAEENGMERYGQVLSEEEIARLRQMVMDIKVNCWIPKFAIKTDETLENVTVEVEEIKEIEKPAFVSKYTIADFRYAKVFENQYPNNDCVLCGKTLGDGKIAYIRGKGAVHLKCANVNIEADVPKQVVWRTPADFVGAGCFPSKRNGTCTICGNSLAINDMIAGKKISENQWLVAHKACAFPERAAIIEASLASSADFDVPGLKLSLRPFQRAAVKYLNDMGGCGTDTDEMGLGKTPTFYAFSQLHIEQRPVLVIVPATLKLNWAREAIKFLPEIPENTVTVLATKRNKKLESMGIRFIEDADSLEKNGIYIISYDMVGKWYFVLRELGIQLLGLDEFHYVKNQKSQRTQSVFGVDLDMSMPKDKSDMKKWNQALQRVERNKLEIKNAIAGGLKVTYPDERTAHIEGLADNVAMVNGRKQIIGLSGTPFENRPIELWPILHSIRPDVFNNFWYFATKFCGAYKDRFGTHYPNEIPESMAKALYEKLRETCMIRRLKKDVLGELPEKQRVTVPLEITNRAEYDRAEEDFIEWLAETGRDTSTAEGKAKALVKIEHLKQLALAGKMAAVKQWIDDFHETGEKLIMFTWHRETVSILKQHYPNALTIVGGISVNEKDAAVQAFQNDPTKKDIIVSIKAGSEGLTLTAASNVAITELGWNPSKHIQGEDRSHRFGQDRGVVCWYLVAEGTIEEWIAELIDSKAETSSNVLDDGRSDKMGIMSESDEKAEESNMQIAIINRYKERSAA